MGKWKGVRYQVLNPEKTRLELYNLEVDPGETSNISTQYPEMMKKIEVIFEKGYNESEVFKFNP